MARPRDRGFPADPQPLPVAIADNHTHLESIGRHLHGQGWKAADIPSLDQHIHRAAEVGVDRMVQVGCDVDTARWTVTAVQEHSSLLGAIAIHPNEAPLHARCQDRGPDGLDPHYEDRHNMPLDEAVALIAGMAAANPRIRAIGETGMDLFRTGPHGAVAQEASFRAHIALAKELGLALQIHDRDAHSQVIDILLKDQAPEKTVFHCFSGDVDMARLCADKGWYLSFAGPVTYRTNSALRLALQEIPLDLMLAETDAPFLTPHPFRGQPNAPYALAHTVWAMASYRMQPIDVICQAISDNSERVYGPW